MNELALRALWFSIPSLSKELRTLKVRDTRFCFFIIIIVISIIIIIIIIIMRTFFFFFIFLDTRDRLNRKGDTARSLEDCRMSKIWWVFFPLRICCFFPFLDFPCSFSRMIDILKTIDESSSQHGIAVTYLLAEGRSWVFSSIDKFLDNFFFLSMQVAIISWSLFRHRQHTLIEYLVNSASF